MAEHGLTNSLSGVLTRARRAEKINALALLIILLTAATASVTSILIGPDWPSLWRSLLFGLLFGWILALFRQPALRSACIILIVGFIYILLFTGGLGGKVAAVGAEFFRTAGSIEVSTQGLAVDLTPLSHQLQELSASFQVIAVRIRDWITALAAGQPAFDPVAAALVWSALVWIIAAWAGWVVEARRNALLAALPAILLSVGTLSYARRAPFLLYLMLGVTLILLATVQQDQREHEWNRTNVAFPSWKGRQIGTVAVFIAIGLVILAALASSFSLPRFLTWISQPRKSPPVQHNGNLATSLGIRPAATAPPDIFETVRRPGLPRDFLIGSGPKLSQNLVMTVAVESPPPAPQDYYWRSFTYDIYTGQGWRSSGTGQSSYPAGEPIQPDHAAGRALLRQEVRPVGQGDGNVYADGEPVRLDIPSEAAWRSSGDLFGIRVGSSAPYEVSSLIPVVDENTLRAAGQQYPDWVRQRYLALPQEVPSRVKDLAIELTASEPTPYDRARAIEGYLRTFPYTLDVPRPPAQQDIVDFFLFDLRKGYCDYYASAMVVLSRAAGVPARLATGYASGTYNINSKRYVVTEADAHSWTEVYFPGIGWVPFEPTAAQPSVDRAQLPPPASSHVQPSEPDATGKRGIGPLLLYLLVGLVLAVFAGIAWIMIDEIHMRRLSEQAAAIEVYRRLRRWAGFLGMESEPGETPYEFGQIFSDQLRSIARSRSTDLSNPSLIRDVNSLIDAIVYISFRPVGRDVPAHSSIIQKWKSMRWQLRGIWLLKFWQSVYHRFTNRLIGAVGQNTQSIE